MHCSGYSRRFAEASGYTADRYCLTVSSHSSACLDPLPLSCLRFRMEVLRGQESFLVPCLAQWKPQSLKNLGSIIMRINNNKHVTASPSSLKSSWVTFVCLFVCFIVFLFLLLPPRLPPLLLLQTTLSCAPAGVWCWIAMGLQIDSAWGYSKLGCSDTKGDTSEREE